MEFTAQVAIYWSHSAKLDLDYFVIYCLFDDLYWAGIAYVMTGIRLVLPI